MRFSDFAQIMYKIHGGKKYDLTRELLCSGLDEAGQEFFNDEMPDPDKNESTKSRLRKYCSGEREITEIAIKIVTYFNEDIFCEYIASMDEVFDQIRKKFGEKGIPIKEGHEPMRLTIIFHEILEQAAKKNPADTARKKSKKRSKTVSVPIMCDQDKNKIAAILIKLSESLECLTAFPFDIQISTCADWLINTGLSDAIESAEVVSPTSNSIVSKVFGGAFDREIEVSPTDNQGTPGIVEAVFGSFPVAQEKAPKQQAFDQVFDTFSSLNDRLKAYCERYDSYKLLNELYQKGQGIEKRMFIPERMAEKREANLAYISQYKSLLLKCSKDILNPTFNHQPAL